MILFHLIIVGVFSCLHLRESLSVTSVFLWKVSIPPNIPDAYSCWYSLCKSHHVCSFAHTSSLTGAHLCCCFFLVLQRFVHLTTLLKLLVLVCWSHCTFVFYLINFYSYLYRFLPFAFLGLFPSGVLSSLIFSLLNFIM